jgi:hypothetical protein
VNKSCDNAGHWQGREVQNQQNKNKKELSNSFVIVLLNFKERPKAGEVTLSQINGGGSVFHRNFLNE